MRKRIDVFPAVVRLYEPGALSDLSEATVKGEFPQGTRRLDRCRVAIVNNTLMIAVDAPGGPQLVFKEKVLEVISEKGIDRITTASDKMLAVIKDENCGCGSRLRSWNPFGSIVNSNEDPHA
jgi:hypothetical protein